MDILGISCFYHDAAACLLRDGTILAAAEEERFSRRKHDAGFPYQSVAYCLRAGGIGVDNLDAVIFYEKPLLKFARIIAGYAATFPGSRAAFVRAMDLWLGGKLQMRRNIRRALGYRGEILFAEHHVAHAASAYFPSPFEAAAVLTVDGVGEWASTTLGVGRGRDLEITHEIRYPHSLGLLYSAFTSYLGFQVNDGEYKVMGMAAYGQPRYVDKVRKLCSVAADGSFRLNMRYFAYHRGLRSISPAFEDLFGPRRTPEADLDQTYADIAASIQRVTEEAMVGLARRARELSGSRQLCLAGGVAFNVLANTRVLQDAGFDDVWIQPAAGDAGGCVGAATYLYHAVLRRERRQPMTTAYLGPGFSNEEIHLLLDGLAIPYTRLAPDDIVPTIAGLLASNHIVGWFQGRMEFGPRALGARSILANPIDPAIKDRLNRAIKHREPFRPFAPSTLAEAASTYFMFQPGAARPPESSRASPFMLLVAQVRPEKQHLLRGVTHVDGTARVQTVSREQNPLYHALIAAFGRLTGVPVIVNTSFNVRGEPIVCTPQQALNTFAHTGLDFLMMGDALVPASSKRTLGPYPGDMAGDDVLSARFYA